MPEADTSLPDAHDASPAEIRRRLSWARRAGHPNYVWKDLPVSVWASAVRAIEDAAAAVLRRRGQPKGGDLPTLAPSGDVSSRALGVAAFTTGTGPLLGRWVEDGALRATAEVPDVMRAHLAHGRIRARRIDTLLHELAPALQAAGLRPVILKGVHTGRRFFPEAGARPTADVDLWVPRRRGADMEACLRSAGYEILLRQRRPTRSVWRVPGDDGGVLRSLDLTHARNPLTLDLHLSLDRGFYGVAQARMPDPTPDDLESVPGLPAVYAGLRGPALVLGLCLHASEDLYNLQLLAVLELTLVSRGAAEGPSLWGRTVSVARERGALGSIFPAVALAARLDPGSVADDAVEACRAEAPAALRKLVDRISPATAQRLVGVTLRERLAAARTPREKLRRVVHMLAPDSAGGSWRSLATLYANRLFKLLGGRVSLDRHRNQGE